MRDAIADVKFELCGSELVALLLESHKIKSHKPLFNRAQRRTMFNYGLYKFVDKNGYLCLNIINLVDGAIPLTSYTTKAEAKQHVFSLVEEYQLCQKLCGLYDTDGACFHHQIHQCNGACIQKESAIEYNQRVENAIKNYQFNHDSFFIIDKGRQEDEKSVIKIEKGKYIGLGYFTPNGEKIDPDYLNDFISTYQDNKDVQQIIRSFLRRNPVEAIIKF